MRFTLAATLLILSAIKSTTKSATNVQKRVNTQKPLKLTARSGSVKPAIEVVTHTC